MTKALALILLVAMAIHLFKPLGLPGLKRRGDVWKIAVAAFVMFGVTVMISHTVG
ncbi:MAG TPA: hypothetical protein VMF90_19095 [Rhizobiaceae bacterium]|nr:hypothetical protein [Rhizobiaceae bacterium]